MQFDRAHPGEPLGPNTLCARSIYCAPSSSSVSFPSAYRLHGIFGTGAKLMMNYSCAVQHHAGELHLHGLLLHLVQV